MPSFDSRNFKIGPCAVMYKGNFIGETKNSSVLNFRATYRDTKCSYAYDQPLEKRILSKKLTLSTEVLAIDNGLSLLFDEDDKFTLNGLGGKQSQNSGELLLIPLNKLDNVGYRIPKALLLQDVSCSFNEEEEHTLRLQFEAFFDENKVMLERFTVDESQRVKFATNNVVDPVWFERAITSWLADKFGMTVDTDIFRGGIPVNADGCGIALTGKKESNSSVSQRYEFCISCLGDTRDSVMKKIHEFATEFPVYGETITLENGEPVYVKAILQKSMDFIQQMGNDGKIKNYGELILEVII
ncbi:hypothetical protein P0136_03650 [Lentisphaerota bacterium ZTH]|nr:hypothetical protein JYG24_05225 [Lentisphaerota bacterium]WET07095.1 hypothetical protein P0136_03650 [Lentisphaerota bacterium ZTH]